MVRHGMQHYITRSIASVSIHGVDEDQPTVVGADGDPAAETKPQAPSVIRSFTNTSASAAETCLAAAPSTR
jgi:hypothetical protein